jgi:hypothetical protein
MPTFTRRVALGANGVVDNVLSGSQYEFMSFPARLEIGMRADATGVLTTIYSGTDVLSEEGPVPIGTINTFPVYPDDFPWKDEAAQGDRFTVKLRDTSGAARVVMVAVSIEPLV